MDHQVLDALGLSFDEALNIPTLSLNQCYHLQDVSREQEFFLKILAPERSAQDRLQELKIQKLASEQQYSPRLIQSAHDANTSWMLMEFIHTRTAPDLHEQIQCLKQIHTLPTEGISKINPLQLADSYLTALRQYKTKNTGLGLLESNLSKLILPPASTLSLCHMDVHPYNFLKGSSQIFMIDFENAGVFDPLYDLAVLGFYLGADKHSLQELLALYRPYYTQLELQHYLSYQKICLNLFLAYLSYHLAYQGEDFSYLAVDAVAAHKDFQKLIQTYYLPKTFEAHVALEKRLLHLGLSASQHVAF